LLVALNVEGADFDVHPQIRIGRRDLVDREPSLRDSFEMTAVLDLCGSTCRQGAARDKIDLQRFGRIDALVVDAEALCTHVGGGIRRPQETCHQNLLGGVSG